MRPPPLLKSYFFVMSLCLFNGKWEKELSWEADTSQPRLFWEQNFTCLNSLMDELIGRMNEEVLPGHKRQKMQDGAVLTQQKRFVPSRASVIS